MTYLTMIQGVTDLIGLPRPTAVIGATDQTSRTLTALANAAGRRAAQLPWEQLKTECTFTTVATESQGVLTTLASGYRSMIPGTMWNRTQQRPVPGAMTTQRWQQFKATVATGPYSEFYIRNGTLYFKPTPTAGHTIAFEYITKNWCQSSALVGQTKWTADTDTGVIDEDMMMYDLRWRYLQSRGLSFEVEYKECREFMDNLLGQNGRAPTLDMSTSRFPRHVLGVPDGNWSL